MPQNRNSFFSQLHATCGINKRGTLCQSPASCHLSLSSWVASTLESSGEKRATDLAPVVTSWLRCRVPAQATPHSLLLQRIIPLLGAADAQKGSPNFLRDSFPSCSACVHTAHPEFISRDFNVSVVHPPERQPPGSPAAPSLEALCPLHPTHVRATP